MGIVLNRWYKEGKYSMESGVHEDLNSVLQYSSMYYEKRHKH